MVVKKEFEQREDEKVTGFTFDFETGQVILVDKEETNTDKTEGVK